MKLSEAIRLGEFALPPHRGAWFKVDHNRNDTICGACAVGRACYAAGFRYVKVSYIYEEGTYLSQFISTTWPWTKNWFYNPPVDEKGYPHMEEYCGISVFVKNPVMRAISNLYECAKWSMPQIADWVATIEPVEVELTVDIPKPQVYIAS